MKFTTKSRYALDALIDLYSRTSLEPVKISEIAVNQSIEMNYLEQLFRKLRIAGLVKSSRGRNGGYVLAMDASLISVKDVMFAVEEDLDYIEFENWLWKNGIRLPNPEDPNNPYPKEDGGDELF